MPIADMKSVKRYSDPNFINGNIINNYLFNTKSTQNIKTIKINNIVIEKIAFISTFDDIWYQRGANL